MLVAIAIARATSTGGSVDPAEQIINSTASRIKVLAGPGTGKSHAMTERVARLLREGVEPKKILAVTFTRLAARDLQKDLTKLDVPGADHLEAPTLHSLAFRLLLNQRIGVSFDRGQRLLAEFERKPLYADLKLGGYRQNAAKDLIDEYEAASADLREREWGAGAESRDRKFERCLVEWLEFHEGMLVGEVIPLLYRHLQAHPEFVDQSRYEHVLVDEYQDLNKAEQCIVDILAGDADICIVGDEDQSIYGFKHAYRDGIRMWPGDSSVEMHSLSLCWRCPTDVVHMANSIIRRNPRSDRTPLEPLVGDRPGHVEIRPFARFGDEAKFVADDIRTRWHDGAQLDDIVVLVLFRQGHR